MTNEIKKSLLVISLALLLIGAALLVIGFCLKGGEHFVFQKAEAVSKAINYAAAILKVRL
jgi:hypothetical protein